MCGMPCIRHATMLMATIEPNIKSNPMNKQRLSLILLLIAAAALARLLPHWPNFTPVTAIALFGAAHLTPKWKAFALPFAALLLSDAIIGFYPQMLVTYIAFAAVTLLGFALQKRRSALRILGVTLCSSCLFFLLSNFALWLPYDIYPKSLEGITQSYLAALPFFQYTLLGDLFYTGLLFGLFALAEREIPSIRQLQAA